MTPDQLTNELISRSANDFDFFLDTLTVKSGRGPVEYMDVMSDFQRRGFNELKPCLEAVKVGTKPPTSRFWIERTKKASKDTDIAACILWLLCFPTRPLQLQVGAADRDQAAIARDRLTDFIHYNPWLNELVKITKYDAASLNGLAHLSIEAADIAGSHGATPDFLVCNELAHVTKWEFIENLLDNADGVPNSLAILATNAGFKNSPAWVLRQMVLQSNNWKALVFSVPAPWHSKDFLQDARKRSTTESRYKRLWHGQWQSGKGDAFTEEMIDRCFRRNTRELLGPEQGWTYVAGLDLGVSNDHAALVVLGANQQQNRIRVATMRAFEPDPRTNEVDLVAVQDHCLTMAKTFNIRWLGYDPHQAVLMSQQLRAKGVPMYEVTFVGKNLELMANRLKETLEREQLECYPDDRLRADFGKFSIVEKSYGLKLEATRDASGHADVGTALAITLPKAVDLLGSQAHSQGDSWDWSEGLKKEDLGDLPQEFKEIFEVYDGIELDLKRKRDSTYDPFSDF